MEKYHDFKLSEKGQGLVEYGLLLGLISVVVAGSLGSVGEGTNKNFDKASHPEIVGKIDQGYIPVASADELNNIREEKDQVFGQGTSWEGTYTSGLDKRYIQVSDLDLSDYNDWVPIDAFTGTYEGSDLSIINLNVDGGDSLSYGLFGEVQGASLKDIRLEDVSVKGSDNVGGLVGKATAGSSIDGVFVSGILHHKEANNGVGVSLGGVVGELSEHSKVSASHSDVILNGQANVGGLAGRVDESEVYQTYAHGVLTGEEASGGLVGTAGSKSAVSQSYAAVEINGSKDSTGGLIGNDGGVKVDRSHWDMDTSGKKETAGDKGKGHPSFDMTLVRTYDGWDFDRVWSVEEGKEYPSFDGETTRLDNVTVTFIGDKEKKYEVTGLVGATLNDYYEGTIPEPVKNGHTFEGWETDKGKAFDMDTILGDNDLTVSPTWKLNEIITKTFDLSEEGAQEQIQKITVDNLHEVISYESDKGEVELLDKKGDDLEFKLYDRPYDRRVQTGGEETLADSKEVSAQNSSSYNKDGYTGSLSKYVYSGSYTPGDTKYVSGQSSSWYNSGGYSGYLNSYQDSYWVPSHTKYVSGQSSSYYNSGGYRGNLSSYLHSGSYTSADSKMVSEEDYWGYLSFHENPKYKFQYRSYSQVVAAVNAMSRDYMGKSKYYNSGGYSGTITVTSHRPGTGIQTDEYGYDYGDITGFYTYTGRVTRLASDTRVYRYSGNVTRDGYYNYYTSYQGNVTKPEVDTRDYRYKGTVNRPYSDTRTWDNFYQYAVTISYREK